MPHFSLSLPENLALSAEDAQFLLLAQLYQLERLSAREAADFLDISLHEFWFKLYQYKIPRLKTDEDTPRRFTPEEYEIVSERVEIKVEYVNGQIVPRESLKPLPVWVVEALLQEPFSFILNYNFPMATKNHANIIRNLVRTLTLALDEDLFLVYGQDPEIHISLSGNYRIPDVGVTPSEEELVWEKEKLLNPLVVIEVLSPSNKGEEFEAKIADYRSIPSLKEYWLVSQKSCSIERFVRNEEDEWDCFSYKSVDEEIAIDILGISLSIEKVYKKIAF